MVAEVSLVNDDSHKTWMTSTLAMMISLCTPNPKRLGTSRRGICLVLPELFGLVRMSRGLRNLLASWGWNRNSAWCMPFVTRISCYVECPLSSYLRAIVVAKGGEPSRSHNLLYLASKAGVATTEKQNGWLEVLSRYVKWAGRYPVPLPKDSADYARLYTFESRHLWNFEKESGSKLHSVLPNTQLDWEPFHQLWKHAQEIYRQHER